MNINERILPHNSGDVFSIKPTDNTITDLFKLTVMISENDVNTKPDGYNASIMHTNTLKIEIRIIDYHTLQILTPSSKNEDNGWR
jgi:hypothetical protein